MSKQWSFKEAITDYLFRPRPGDGRQPALWPSEASALYVNEHGETAVAGKCRRAVALRYFEALKSFHEESFWFDDIVREAKAKELPVDRYMRWIWEAGNLYEQYCIELAKSSGVFINTQVQVFIKDWNVSGKTDLDIINPVTHKYSIVEAKSVYGFNATNVVGKPGNSKRGPTPGTPRFSNFMQILIYHWWRASANDNFEESRLVYGARDTGVYSEFLIYLKQGDDGLTYGCYRQISPREFPEVVTPITIEAIRESYSYIQRCAEAGVLPPRDFELVYSPEVIQKKYDRGELTKADTETHEKALARIQENKERAANGEKPKVELKPVKLGDWECSRCNKKLFCYDENEQPRGW